MEENRSLNGRPKSFYNKLEFKKMFALVLIFFSLVMLEFLLRFFDMDFFFKKELLLNILNNFRVNGSLCILD